MTNESKKKMGTGGVVAFHTTVHITESNDVFPKLLPTDSSSVLLPPAEVSEESDDYQSAGITSNEHEAFGPDTSKWLASGNTSGFDMKNYQNTEGDMIMSVSDTSRGFERFEEDDLDYNPRKRSVWMIVVVFMVMTIGLVSTMYLLWQRDVERIKKKMRPEAIMKRSLRQPGLPIAYSQELYAFIKKMQKTNPTQIKKLIMLKWQRVPESLTVSIDPDISEKDAWISFSKELANHKLAFTSGSTDISSQLSLRSYSQTKKKTSLTYLYRLWHKESFRGVSLVQLRQAGRLETMRPATLAEVIVFALDNKEWFFPLLLQQKLPVLAIPFAEGKKYFEIESFGILGISVRINESSSIFKKAAILLVAKKNKKK